MDIIGFGDTSRSSKHGILKLWSNSDEINYLLPFLGPWKKMIGSEGAGWTNFSKPISFNYSSIVWRSEKTMKIRFVLLGLTDWHPDFPKAKILECQHRDANAHAVIPTPHLHTQALAHIYSSYIALSTQSVCFTALPGQTQTSFILFLGKFHRSEAFIRQKQAQAPAPVSFSSWWSLAIGGTWTAHPHCPWQNFIAGRL
jgi:hypothetical protein